MDNDNTIELVNNLKDIPAMPNIIVKALQLLKSDDAGVPELAQLIKCDQALCTKMLAIINSAYYGFPKQITSINMAISLLGLKRTKNIIITVAMNPLLSQHGAKSMWAHSIYSAVGCEYLASKYKLMNSDDAFVIGFLHDIGKIVLNLIDADKYQQIMQRMDLHPDFRMELENDIMQTNHVLTGAFLAVRWQLPEIITNSIRYHHFPLKAKEIMAPALTNIVNSIVQEKFENDWFDYRLAETIKLTFEKEEVEELREDIIQKGNVLLRELS